MKTPSRRNTSATLFQHPGRSPPRRAVPGCFPALGSRNGGGAKIPGTERPAPAFRALRRDRDRGHGHGRRAPPGSRHGRAHRSRHHLRVGRGSGGRGIPPSHPAFRGWRCPPSTSGARCTSSRTCSIRTMSRCGQSWSASAATAEAARSGSSRTSGATIRSPGRMSSPRPVTTPRSAGRTSPTR